MREYRVQIEIEVSASTPQEAAQQAWGLLTDPSASLPVCDVFGPSALEEFIRVDLEEAYHDCMEHAVEIATDGPLGHGWACNICGNFLQAG